MSWSMAPMSGSAAPLSSMARVMPTRVAARASTGQPAVFWVVTLYRSVAGSAQEVVRFSIAPLDARLLALLAEEPRIGVLECSRRLQVARGTVQARLDKLT